MDYPKILGVAANATEDDIKTAYKAMALKWHPDRNLDDSERATEKFVEINRAYRALMRERRHSTKAAKEESSRSERSSSKSSPSTKPTSNSSSSTHPKSSSSSHSKSSNGPAPNPTHTSHSHSHSSSSTHTRSSSSSHSKSRETPPSTKESSPSSSTSHAKSSSSSKSRDVPASTKTSHSSSSSSSSASRSSSGSYSTHTPRHNPEPSFTYSDRGSTCSYSTSESDAASTSHTYVSSDSHGQKSNTRIPHEVDAETDPASSKSPKKLRKQSKPTSGRPENSDFLPKPSPRRRKSDGREEDDEQIPLSGYGSPLLSRGESSKEWTYTLRLTLGELLRGKHFCFRVVRYLLSGKTKNVVLDVDVPPGCVQGTKIVFRGAGHERKDGTRQDIVFLIEEVAHDRFTRARDDLIMDVRLPWVESLNHEMGEVHFDGVDNASFMFMINFPKEKAMSGTFSFPGAGMPRRDGDGRRGKLIIRWEIVASPQSKWETLKQVLRFKG